MLKAYNATESSSKRWEKNVDDRRGQWANRKPNRANNATGEADIDKEREEKEEEEEEEEEEDGEAGAEKHEIFARRNWEKRYR